MKTSVLILCTILVSCSCQTVEDEVESYSPAQVFKTIVTAKTVANNDTVDGFKKLTLIGSVDGRSVRPLIDELANVDSSVKGFILEINSGGGSVDDGFLLSKAIENSTVPVHCVVDGDGMSMAFYILQSCTIRMMTKRSVLMIHQPSVGGTSGGNVNQLLELGEYLDNLYNAMVEHCTRRTLLTPAQLKAKIDKRAWWMGHEEALKLRVVDFVVTTTDDAFIIAKAHK